MSNTGVIICGIAFIFVMTTLGAAMVFFFRGNISPKVNTVFLGFASGVMIAASVWSLLLPSIEAAAGYGKLSWLPAAVGFIIGGLFLILIDKVVPHFHSASGEEEGLKTSLNKTTKLFLAVTIHNIPEGLAVGFAFGAALATGAPAAYMGAVGLAIGIGVQNFPEGAAISLPMKAGGKSNFKAFLIGMGSGAVEPVAAVLGLLLASFLTVLQPWLLAFAAGAMIFVIAEDLIPDSKHSDYPHLGTWGVMIGFVIMMVLDVALG